MPRVPWPLALIWLVVAVVVGLVLVSNDESDTRAGTESAEEASAKATDVGCSSGIAGPAQSGRTGDVAFGPLVLGGGLRWARAEPDAFNRHGYKIPAALPDGSVVTLSVPPSLRGRVGLVFTDEAQDRVERMGVRGADKSVRFTACPAGEQPGGTDWPGGLVVDHPRCATLVATVAGGPTVRRRVPLGRHC